MLAKKIRSLICAIKNFVHHLIPGLSTKGLAWGSLAIIRALALLRWLCWVHPAQMSSSSPVIAACQGLLRRTHRLHRRGCRCGGASSALPPCVRPRSALTPIPVVPITKPGWLLKPQPPSSQGPDRCLWRILPSMTGTLPVLQRPHAAAGQKTSHLETAPNSMTVIVMWEVWLRPPLVERWRLYVSHSG